MSSRKKILILSGYDIPSHRSWHNTLKRLWTQVAHVNVLALPPRYFSWRVRGNSLSFSKLHRQTITEGYDLIVATSMVDLSSLIGFLPEIATIPKIVYFHENQFAYPRSDFQRPQAEILILGIYNAICADYVFFNSQYNRTTFLKGAKDFLQKMPDQVPKNIISEIKAKSSVYSVPVEEPYGNINVPKKSHRILWNHRWEYDKGCAHLLEILRTLHQQKTEFELVLLGQRFREAPEEMATILSDFKHNIVFSDYIDTRIEYFKAVAGCGIALSTSLHEFQGLSLMEATLCGAIPIAPQRLCYPEFYPLKNLYPSSPEIKIEAKYAAELIQKAILNPETYRVNPELYKNYEEKWLNIVWKGLDSIA